MEYRCLGYVTKKTGYSFPIVALAEAPAFPQALSEGDEKGYPRRCLEQPEAATPGHWVEASRSKLIAAAVSLGSSGGTGAPTMEGVVRKRVLVVDDERPVADTLVAILRMSGYEATGLYDGASALLHCQSQVPDLIVSDVVMPGLSGIELAIFVKEHYPDCKVLLFSGMAATADLLQAARDQGYDFEVLAKPVHPSDLLSKIAA